MATGVSIPKVSLLSCWLTALMIYVIVNDSPDALLVLLGNTLKIDINLSITATGFLNINELLTSLC